MSPAEAQPLLESMKRASDAGVIFVTAAGNGDESGVGYNIDYLNIYPASANFENSITVAATDQSDLPTRFSNVGKRKVHLAAPGLSILSTLPGNRYDELSGTSMSAPLVSGLVALLKSIQPSLNGSEIKSLLQNTGQQIEIRNACQCRVDAEAAVSKLMNQEDFLIPDAATLKIGDSLQFQSFYKGANFYLSSDEKIASIDFKSGILKAKSSGKVKVSAQDESGSFMTSHWIRIKAEGESEDDSEDSSSSSSDPYACPMQSPEECKQACIDHPGLPWCEISSI
jgi:subtilisin family serine protease